MAGIQKLQWNERVQSALLLGVFFGVAAVASRRFSRSRWFREEARSMFRDLSVISGTFSFISFLAAYGLALPKPRSSSLEIQLDDPPQAAVTCPDDVPVNPVPDDQKDKLNNHLDDNRCYETPVYMTSFSDVQRGDYCEWLNWGCSISELRECLKKDKEASWTYPWNGQAMTDDDRADIKTFLYPDQQGSPS